MVVSRVQLPVQVTVFSNTTRFQGSNAQSDDNDISHIFCRQKCCICFMPQQHSSSSSCAKCYNQHQHIVFGDVEETVITHKVVKETNEEIVKKATRPVGTLSVLDVIVVFI
mmetsp:Transcript_27676/g.40493  ORF Transcript_27676/g.40493 Transcript_27676/m.40493 type:complete len:111 (+) Transcript_27676:178-510(+)